MLSLLLGLLTLFQTPHFMAFSSDTDTDDYDSAFSPHHEHVLLSITITESALSFICSAIIVLSYLKFTRLRKFSLQLVFWLSLSDMGVCVSYFFGDPTDGTLRCYSQAMIMSFFELASVLWTTVIAYTLFRLIILQKTSVHLINRFHAFAFGLPLLAMLMPLTTNSYGNSGAWCWITTPSDNVATDPTVQENFFQQGTIWRLFLFYLPLWLAIGFNTGVYILVTNALQRVAVTQTALQRPKYLKMVKRLRLYPLILVFCWAGVRARRWRQGRGRASAASLQVHNTKVKAKRAYRARRFSRSPVLALACSLARLVPPPPPTFDCARLFPLTFACFAGDDQ